MDLRRHLAEGEAAQVGERPVEHGTIAHAGDHRVGGGTALHGLDGVAVAPGRAIDDKRRSGVAKTGDGAEHDGAVCGDGRGLLDFLGKRALDAARELFTRAGDRRGVAERHDDPRDQPGDPRPGGCVDRRVAQPGSMAIFGCCHGGYQQQPGKERESEHNAQIVPCSACPERAQGHTRVEG